jgi:hypothetical protein
MKKLLILLIFLIPLPSCSINKIRVHPKQTGIDPVFKPYIVEYRNLIGKKTLERRFDKLHMNFADLEGNILGRCYWLLGGDFEIEIDKGYWDRPWNSLDKKFTVYHELEHCIRFRMHTNKKIKIKSIEDFFEVIGYYIGFMGRKGFLKDGCPASLMHSHSFSINL